ncbi:hypothetical protein GCM10010252_03330 [Streptomyces aureoverticillatus]|nr:hypothetical protein GCM10010252_03330 [Streptomyces aureoverticillatus]
MPAAGAPAERPRPLHDPDPYSTPPYGEPGPWAPAPPVQHPMATPAQGTPAYGTPGHGTPVPGAPAPGTPAPGTPPHGASHHGAPGPAAQAAGASAHGAPSGGGQHPGAPAQGMPAPAAAAQGTPPHGVQPSGSQGHGSYQGAPSHGHQVPGAPAAAAQGTPPPGVQPPGPQGHGPHQGAPSHGHQAPGAPAAGPQAPAPHAHSGAHAVPAQPAPATGTAMPGAPAPGAPAPGASHPHSTPAAAPAQGTHAQAALAHQAPAHQAPAHGAPAQGAPAPGTPTDPWQRYDPWSAPLQQTGAAVETSGQRRRRGRRAIVVGAAVIALVAGGIGGVVGAYLEREGGIGSDVELPQAGSESEKRPKDSVAGIAASALPGVVTLHVRGDDGAGTGTGFVLDGKGHILTNNHVVEPAGTGGEIEVTFSGGETASAKVIGRDAGYDLAVVKVSGVRGLKPLPLGNSENVQVGDPVVAIGAPFDLANTVTSGIISAKERPITAGGEKGDGSDVSYVNALQTDAPINPGNSGGPLVDAKARVIGINSAIRSAGNDSAPEGGQSGSIGLGFAIPINQGKRVAEELINTGRATHPVIGVTIDKQFNGDGARIARKSQSGGPAVNRGGPGAKAGLKPGDVITAVDGRRVHSGDELIVKVRAHRPKDRLELTVERDGDERKVTLVLGTAGGE